MSTDTSEIPKPASHPYCVVDVFAEAKYAGNPLSVVIPSTPLSAEAMQAIAREMNHSETAFLLAREPAAETSAWPVRIFTPAAEVPFAGHPSIGAAWVIAKRLAPPDAREIILDLPLGHVAVTFAQAGQEGNEEDGDAAEILWLRPPAPAEFGYAFDPASLAPLFGLGVEDIDPVFPVQPVSLGVNFVLIPVRTLAAVERAAYNAALRPVHSIPRPVAYYLFCPETLSQENTFHARMFGPDYGVAEDPATGSANACLAAYLHKHHWFGRPEFTARVEQGHEISRPSLLHLRSDKQGNVSVGGRVVLTAVGELV